MLGLRSTRNLAPFNGPGNWVSTWGASLRQFFPTPQPAETTLPLATEWSAMGIPAAWRCATLICDTIANLPTYAYRLEPDGSEARLDPTPDVLRDPWPMIAYHDWHFGVVWSLLLRGDAFALPADPDPSTGYPRQFVLLNPDEVWVDVDRRGMPRYSIGTAEYGPGEVLHIRGICPPGSVRGIGIIEAHRRGFSTLAAMEMYGTSSYAASGVPSGTITVDRPDLGEQQANDLKARWMAAFTGTREPAVLPRSITFTPIAFSPTDMSYIEARKLGATEVCWMFGVHPMMIGAPAGTAMTYGNVESVSAAFARDSLTGWTSRVEQGLTKWVPISSIVRYDYGGMLRGTTLERYQAHEIGLRIGLETLNEARDLEHRTRFDDPLADEPAPLQHKPEPPKPVVLQPDGTPAPPIDAKTGEPQLALIKGGSQ